MSFAISMNKGCLTLVIDHFPLSQDSIDSMTLLAYVIIRLMQTCSDDRKGQKLTVTKH